MSADAPDPADPLGPVRAMWEADAASRALGMRLADLSPGWAVVTMRVRPDMVNGHGLAHGGLVAALADSAFACACNGRGAAAVAAGFDVTFLRAARLDDELWARAVEREVVGRSGLYDVTVRRGEDAAAEVVAEFRGRSRVVG